MGCMGAVRSLGMATTPDIAPMHHASPASNHAAKDFGKKRVAGKELK